MPHYSHIIILDFWLVVLFIISKFSGGGSTTVVPVLDGYVLQKVLLAILSKRNHILDELVHFLSMFNCLLYLVCYL